MKGEAILIFWLIAILLVGIILLLVEYLSRYSNAFDLILGDLNKISQINQSTNYKLMDIKKSLLRQEIPLRYEESEFADAMVEKYSRIFVCKKCLLRDSEIYELNISNGKLNECSVCRREKIKNGLLKKYKEFIPRIMQDRSTGVYYCEECLINGKESEIDKLAMKCSVCSSGKDFKFLGE